MADKKYYLTTAIPYVNAKPHIGHALEYVIADAIYRFLKVSGQKTYLVSGADENALKNVQAAEKLGKPVKQFLDDNSGIFAEFYKLLEVELDTFRRGTDEKYHWPGVQKLWKLVFENGDIYKKKYKGAYCVGCEEFKTEKELVDGKCPIHDRAPEVVEEENYFFRLSNYQEKLLNLIESGEYNIIPQKRKNEILSFIKDGLEDISISRSKARAKGVGVPVPDDDTQLVYVWFDALNIYQTGVGFGYNERLWKQWWPANLHIIGKDIIRFHAVYWPAILLSADLPLPKNLLVHGFITSGGIKMSKTIGNVIDPYEIIEKYGVESLRYYLLSQVPTKDDGDFTIQHFEEIYQADLANGLGNLVSRIAGLASREDFALAKSPKLSFSPEVIDSIETYDLDKALAFIWYQIKEADLFINKRSVWNLKGNQKKAALANLVRKVRQIAYDLKPFMPKTSGEIDNQFKGPNIKVGKPLFPRLTK
jgi:methionyl-tRNA synthetase